MANTNSYNSKTSALTTTPVKVLDQNNNRKVLLLFNQSAVAIRIYFDSTNAANYIELPVGQGLNIFENAPLNEVYAFTPSGSANLTVIEA